MRRANGEPISYTQLLVSGFFDLEHEVLQPDYVPRPPSAQLLTVGDISGVGRLDANAFVAQCIAGMGQR